MSVVLEHECRQRDRAIEGQFETCGTHGPAFRNLPFWSEESGCWAVGNGEYASPVWFCPYCGEELRPHRGEVRERERRVKKERVESAEQAGYALDAVEDAEDRAQGGRLNVTPDEENS